MKKPLVALFLLSALFLSGCSDLLLFSNISVKGTIPLGLAEIEFEKKITPEEIKYVSSEFEKFSLPSDIKENSVFAARVSIDYAKSEPRIADSTLVLTWDPNYIEFLRPADLETYPITSEIEAGENLASARFRFGELKPGLKEQEIDLVGKTRGLGTLRFAGAAFSARIEDNSNSETIVTTHEQVIKVVK